MVVAAAFYEDGLFKTRNIHGTLTERYSDYPRCGWGFRTQVLARAPRPGPFPYLVANRGSEPAAGAVAPGEFERPVIGRTCRTTS